MVIELLHLPKAVTKTLKNDDIKLHNASSSQDANIDSSCTSGTFAHLTAYSNVV